MLHAALLTLQFGVPGKGLPSSGWLWGARSASAPSASLHVELQAAPVETRVSPSAVLPVEAFPARTTAAPPVPLASEASKTGFVARLLDPPKKEVKEVKVLRKATPSGLRLPPRTKSFRQGKDGTPILSVRKKPAPEDWRVTASGEGGREDSLPQARPVVGDFPAHELSAEPLPAPLPVLPDPGKMPVLTKAESSVSLSSAEDVRPEVPSKLPEISAAEDARRLQQQMAERAQAERIAAQALQQQREEAQARAKAQAEEVRRRAERAALARMAEEDAVREEGLRQQQRQQHQQALAEEARKIAQARLEAERFAAREREEKLQAERAAQAEQQLRLEKIAQEQAQARALAQAAAEEAARQAELAREAARARAAAVERARVAELAQAAAEARAAAEAQARQGEQALTSRTGGFPGSGRAGSAVSSGRSLAEQAMALARSGLPMKPPVDTDSLAQGARRVLGGRNPAEVQLSFYNDSWVQKVERLSRVNYPQLSRHRAYGSLVVSVTIRSDGSLAGVHVLKGSGSREIDEAARRLIEMSAPFAAFPPDLRRVHDTVEITRTLSFPDRPPLLITQ